MRFPNPPRGSVSWFGKRRSYDFIPISQRRDIASVRRYDAICRAAAAGTRSAKKNHACAPFPDRDRSTATGNPAARDVSAKAETSHCQPAPSKSTATKWQRSPSTSGYTPATTSPWRWS